MSFFRLFFCNVDCFEILLSRHTFFVFFWTCECRKSLGPGCECMQVNGANETLLAAPETQAMFIPVSIFARVMYFEYELIINLDFVYHMAYTVDSQLCKPRLKLNLKLTLNDSLFRSRKSIILMNPNYTNKIFFLLNYLHPNQSK